MIFATSFFQDLCIGFFLFMLVMFWLAKKAGSNPTVQKGALDLFLGLFKK